MPILAERADESQRDALRGIDTMCYVRHGTTFQTGAHPTVITA